MMTAIVEFNRIGKDYSAKHVWKMTGTYGRMMTIMQENVSRDESLCLLDIEEYEWIFIRYL